MSTPVNRWTDDDRRRFADGEWLRAQTVPPADKPAPEVDEWDGWDGPDWSMDAWDDIPLTCGIENPESREACD